jgi:hypothetical protein
VIEQHSCPDRGDPRIDRRKKTGGNARELDANDHPIAALHAAGNDMAGIMGGTTPPASRSARRHCRDFGKLYI